MSCPELVMADHVIVVDFVPFRGTNLMVCSNELVADEAILSHCIQEVVSRHFIPMAAIDLRIVDLMSTIHISPRIDMTKYISTKAYH